MVNRERNQIYSVYCWLFLIRVWIYGWYTETKRSKASYWFQTKEIDRHFLIYSCKELSYKRYKFWLFHRIMFLLEKVSHKNSISHPYELIYGIIIHTFKILNLAGAIISGILTSLSLRWRIWIEKVRNSVLNDQLIHSISFFPLAHHLCPT